MKPFQFKSVLAVCAVMFASGGAALAQPAWYTPGVGGFNPNVPKFYQHQDFIGGNFQGTNSWENGGGWCGWVAYDDIFYALTQQGYKGLYGTAMDPTTNPWYASTYGAGNDLYNVTAINNSGNPADSLSTVFVGTGGSVNNLAKYITTAPAGTTGALNGVGGTSANGFTLNYTPALGNGKFTGASFTASPGIQFNSGVWTSAANGNVNVDATRDKVNLTDLGLSSAAVAASDIGYVVQNMGTFDVQNYLDTKVNNQAANNGKAALWSGTWNVNGNGIVNYLSLQNGSVVQLGMLGVTPVKFTSGVMAICNGQEVIKINQGNLSAPGQVPANPAPYFAANNANGQGLWWAANTPADAAASLAAGKGEFYHMLAVSGISVAGNQLYLADPDTNPSNPAGATGVAQANGGWPSDNPSFPGNAPFNLKTPSGAGLPVPAAPVVGNGNAATWNQLYTDFSFTPNGTFDSITSAQSTQYNGCGLKNLQTIMKNPFKLAGAAPAGAGKEATAIALTLPSDTEDEVDQIFVEPSQQSLDPLTNPGADSFNDPSEPSGSWGEAEEAMDPFGNSLSDDGIDYDLTGGTGLLPGESATIDIGTDAEFALEGYDVLLHYAPDADDPTGFWMPYMEDGSEEDASAAISGVQEEVPEPTAASLLAIGMLGLASRRRRAREQ